MKIKLTESQFERLKKIGFLTEQTNPFYAQEKTSSGAINPNSDYRYSGGGPMARPQGAIDVKYLFPSQVPQGGYPQKLTKQEVSDILAGKAYKGVVRNSLNNTVAPQITPQIRDAIQGKPPAPLPYDWQREEQNYAAFNEPLGKPDRMVTGKYRGNRGPLPAQTNKYFYNPNAKVSSQQKGLNSAGKSVTQTVNSTGAWEIKTLENVDLWRDVPKGYYPPDYPKALAFDKEYKAPANSNSAESTGVNKNLRVKINPYFTPQFPLGLSQEAISARKSMLDAKEKELSDLRNQPTRTVAGSDYFASVDTQNKQKAQQLIFNKIKDEKSKIDASFGKYVATQNKEEGYDWVGFLLTIASVLPVVGPAATVLNVGYNLVNAVRAYEKGDYAQAGLNTLFAVLPGLSRTLKGSNLLNVLRAGGQEAVALEKYLAQNASTMYREVVGKLTQSVEQNLASATSQELLFIEKSIGKFTEQYSLKGAAKATAGEVDKYAKGKTDVINPLAAYVPGM
jgi:hypothetical protein